MKLRSLAPFVLAWTTACSSVSPSNRLAEGANASCSDVCKQIAVTCTPRSDCESVCERAGEQCSASDLTKTYYQHLLNCAAAASYTCQASGPVTLACQGEAESATLAPCDPSLAIRGVGPEAGAHPPSAYPSDNDGGPGSCGPVATGGPGTGGSSPDNGGPGTGGGPVGDCTAGPGTGGPGMTQ